MEDAGRAGRVMNCAYESMGENPRQEEGRIKKKKKIHSREYRDMIMRAVAHVLTISQFTHQGNKWIPNRFLKQTNTRLD